MEKKKLYNTRLGSIVRIRRDGRRYLYNTLTHGLAVLVTEDGNEFPLSFHREVYVESEGTTSRRDFVKGAQ